MKVRYTLHRSPLGWILLASTRKGLCRLSISADRRRLLRELRNEFGSCAVRDDVLLAKHVNDLTRYLKGERIDFCGPFDLCGTHFQRSVWKVLRTIPYGEVRTYGQVAEQAGRPKGFRAVGQAVGRNPVAIMVPCHRVIAAGRKIGGFGAGVDAKKRLLELEGVSKCSLR